VTPELSDRLAKLLRLACDGGATDGEKLAAVGKLGAIAAANNVDWDLALANGSSPALTEEAMRQIYDEGYRRGYGDGQQATRPERDWTPTDGTSAEVGSDAERFHTILDTAAQANGLLTKWEANFASDMRSRFERFGQRMYVSAKQWAILDRLETKFRRAGIL
jgi:hypothetical protein